MKTHHRSTTLLLAAGLLGMAALLGISRWQQPAPTPESATTTPRISAGASNENPISPALPASQGERMTTKVSQRPPAVATARGIDRSLQPRPGEPTYRLDSLPKAQGTYWVENGDGTFSRLAVSPPEASPGESQ